MGKKAELLAEQIETVNTEMSRLGLPKISGNKEEEALVDSAYDQMGVNVLLQNVAILVAVSLPLISFQFVAVTARCPHTGPGLHRRRDHHRLHGPDENHARACGGGCRSGSRGGSDDVTPEVTHPPAAPHRCAPPTPPATADLPR